MRISVITATYNSALHIASALKSVNEQAHPDVEHILVDGGSTDDTLALVSKLGRRLAQHVSEPDRGIYDALNKGIRLATGDIIGFLHSDDMYSDDRVLEEVAARFVSTGCDAVYGDLNYVSSDGGRVIRHWRAGQYRQELLRRGWMPPHPTFFMKRSLYEQLGGFDERFGVAADYDSMVRYLSAGLHVEYLPRVLIQMRVGGKSNGSLADILRKMREDYTIIRRHRIGGIGTLAFKNLSKLPQFFERKQ